MDPSGNPQKVIGKYLVKYIIIFALCTGRSLCV